MADAELHEIADRKLYAESQDRKLSPKAVSDPSPDSVTVPIDGFSAAIPPKSAEVVPFKKDQHLSHVFPHLRVSNTII